MRTFTLTELLLVLATLSLMTIAVGVGHIAGWW